MKKKLLELIVLCALLTALGSAIGVSRADGPSQTVEGAPKSSGMPGPPIPQHPIPHHNPGGIFRGADVSLPVTRRKAAGVEKTVELKGIDAMLANDTMSDPFAGNYDVVNLDQLLLVRNRGQTVGLVEVSAWSAFVEPDVITTPTIIAGSAITVGGITPSWAPPAVTAGDLNGDNRAEQIVAWRDFDTAKVFLSIGGLAGTQGRLSSAPAAVAHNDGAIDLLARGFDNALWHRHYNGADWGEWNNNAGGYLKSAPAVASPGDGQFYVFAAGVYSPTIAIYQRHWNGSAWSADWELVDVHLTDGAELAGDPAATISGTNQIDLFSRASDNTLRWLHYDGAAWGTWQNLGGFITSSPTVVSEGGNRLQVFARGFDEALWYITYDGANWGQWQRQEGLALNSKPAAITTATGQVDVYARGTDNALWANRLENGSWSTWQSLGGALDSAAAAVVHNGRIDLFAQTADDPATSQKEEAGYAQHNSYVSNAWSGWQNQGGLKNCCVQYDTGQQAARVAVETGYFTGDGREQIVLAYSNGSSYGVMLYGIQDGFQPALLAEKRWTDDKVDGSDINHFTLDVSTGDMDGDGRDEIGLVVSGKRTDGANWNTGTYFMDVSANPWKLDLKWSETPVDADNTYGAFVITSGDFDGNGDDEFVTAWTRCGWPFGWTNPYCDAKMTLYDYQENWAISSAQILSYGHWDHAYPDLDLAAADMDQDPKTRADEIVYAGIADGTDAISELAIWSVKTFTDPQKIEVETLPVDNLSFKLATGDFNRDLKPEAAFAYHTDSNTLRLGLYGYDNTQNFGELVSLDLASSDWTENGRFALAAGDVTGESLRVGPPTYRREKSTNNILAILNAPPAHQDTLDGQEYKIGVDGSYSLYEKGQETENTFSHKFSHNWGLAEGASIGAGDPRGTHISVSIDRTYGGHFEQANITSQSVMWNQSVQTAGDDVLLLSYSDYDIWEYPVYADSGRVPDSYITVIFPVAGSSGVNISPGNICQSWYKPTHQVGNLWSYPLDEVDFNGYVPGDEASHLYVGSITTGGAEYNWTHQMTENDTTQLSHREYIGVAAGYEAKVGGDEVEVSGGFIIEAKTKSRTPFVAGYLKAEYNFEYLYESEAGITKQTTVKTHIGEVASDSSYTSESHLFWAKEGYLKLDYTANPEPHAFWNKYDKPDPTFIRPWTDGHCDSPEVDRKDFSRDITIRPFYANRGATVTISATVRNYSNVSANNVKVRFYLGDPDNGGQQIGADQNIPALARAAGPETVSVEWTASGSGMQRIYAVVDPDKELAEMHDETSNTNNNKGYNLIKIGQANNLDPAMSEDNPYYHLSYTLDTGTRVAASPLSTTQSVSFTAYVPPANLDEITLFSFTSLDDPPAGPSGLSPIGDALALEAFPVGAAPGTDVNLKPATGSPPALITVQYDEAALRDAPEENLRFYTWTGAEWTEPTCAGRTPMHLSDDNMFIAPICETGTFALFAAGNQSHIYLPLVLR